MYVGSYYMNTCFALMGLSGGELVLVLAAILILFGAKRIPEFAKGLGQGIKEFKKASSDVTNEFHNAMNQEHQSPPPPKPLPASESTAPAATVPKS
jgi:sec-independent protein translocase protein TatA